MHVYNPCSCQIFKMNGGDKMRYFMGIDNGGTFSKAALFDENGNLYIPDFCANAIVKVTKDGYVSRLAQSPDCDGLDGGLDQPGEPIIYDGKIVASCFDLVTGPGKVNTAHEMPATLAEVDIS